uniref:Pkinase_Tyr domain-containing protein n=1 Tax=Macrostomum lignano TaxID=282301 RepID=A0A1I8JPA5_9PLAT
MPPNGALLSYFEERREERKENNVRTRSSPSAGRLAEAATDKVFTNKSDVWSFGVLIYEVRDARPGSVPGASEQSDSQAGFGRPSNAEPRTMRQQGIRCDEFLMSVTKVP